MQETSENYPFILNISLEFIENAQEYTWEISICMKASQGKQVYKSSQVCIQAPTSNLMKIS